MAELENNKPKTEKTSASVTSTLPRLCPTTKLYLKDASTNIPKLKSQPRGGRSVSNESQKRPGFINLSKTNLQKSKLTESKKSSQVGFACESLFVTSPRNYRGQIPVLHRHSLNFLRMSPPGTRSTSPIKKPLPKEKSSTKVKTITLENEAKKKSKTGSPRSPSPARKTTSSFKRTKSRTSTSPPPGSGRNSEKVGVKHGETTKQATTSPRKNSPAKRKSKSKIASSSNIEFAMKGKPVKGPQTTVGESVVLKQSSQPSLCVNEKIIHPEEKISLDHLKSEVYGGDRRLSFEKVHLCIEKSTEKLNLAESKRSFFVTYSSENVQQQEKISLAVLQNLSSTNLALPSSEGDEHAAAEPKAAIRTLSGHELVLTPSMKLDIDREGISESIEISKLLHESENFEEKKDVHIPQDDANEYDSEMSTDGEDSAPKGKRFSATRVANAESSEHSWRSANSLWKSREADLLNDVDYRQSVYHPAVSRRQKGDSADVDFKGKTRSLEDSFDFEDKVTTDTRGPSHSTSLQNKYMSQTFISDKMDSNSNDRSWVSGFDKTDGRQMYDSVLEDVPFYGTKRIRSKKERASGALLHFTLKMIRLLAIFNIWPGDNCYMLTSQLLR